MKNLKKVLALVLVVATLMTMTTIASAKFTDANDIEYTEAVDVLTGINVINGYTDGSFRPTGNVTRAQMAKMVAYIVAGGEDVGSLYAGANSFSDCTTHWAKGYIAYANKTGIVAGVGGGKFNPDGSVTGTQAAKMMLCALGYDASTEGYTGTNWAVNVLSDARDAGLLKGLTGVDMSKAMTREQAAQLMFNALKADMVEYDRGDIIVGSGDNQVIIGGSAAKKVTNKDEAKDTYNNKKDEVTQLCEKYFPNLKLSESNQTDAFGRPAVVWTYGKPAKEIGTYAKEADLTYTKAVEGGDLYKDLGKPTVASTEYYADSKNETSVPGGFAIAKDNSVKIGGNGTLLEVYTSANASDDTKTDVLIVAVNTYSGKISSVTAAKGDDARYVTVNGMKYETESFAKDDIVLYTKADGKIQTMTAPEKVSGKVTSINATKGTFVVDGTTYEWGAKGNSSDITVKSEYDFYLDANGYVVYAEVVKEAAAQYAVVLDYANKSWTGATEQDVKLLLADGSQVVVSAKPKNSSDKFGTNININDIVAYTVSDDIYTVNTVATSAVNSTLNKGAAAIGSGVSGNNSTVFIVKDSSASDPTYTAYTGIGEIPSMINVTGKVYAEDGVAKFVYITSAENTTTDADKLTYITFTGAETVTDETGTYKVCNAVVDGEITTVKVSTSATVVTGTGLYKSLSYNKDGIITKGTAATLNTDYKSATGTTADNNGLLVLGGVGYGYAKDVAVFSVDKDGVITSASISNVETDINDQALFVLDKDGVIDVLYLIPSDGGLLDTVINDAVSGVVNSDSYNNYGSLTVSGNTVTATGSKDYINAQPADEGGVTKITADLAQFLGALYKKGNATEIKYGKNTYTWDASSAGNLAGSNWYGNGQTLVKAITDTWKGTDGWKTNTTYTAELVVNGVAMTYTAVVGA